eukprot:GHVR01187112.1.p1 GENE.GHVR01187112.1~~GHVR01187112.1.p1  ORF type:complete len:100 (-),score=2.86 GHVR01187112.1:69-368(-)
MKQAVTLYKHRNVDCREGGTYGEQFEVSTHDMSKWDHCNYLLLGTEEIEVEIPDVDYREKAVAKFDKQIADIKADAACRVRQVETKKQELLAIGNEVAA